MKIFSFSKSRFLTSLIAIFASVFLVAVVVFGATTISNNIDTAGTLDADGLSTLGGGVLVNSSTSTITNLVTINATSTSATSTSLHISGALRVAAASSTISTLRASTFTLGGGTNHTGFVSGFCNIPNTTVTASSSAFAVCSSATGVQDGDKVFMTATSSLGANFFIQAASSTPTAGEISVRIYNTGYPVAVTTTGVISFNFWAVR